MATNTVPIFPRTPQVEWSNAVLAAARNLANSNFGGL